MKEYLENIIEMYISKIKKEYLNDENGIPSLRNFIICLNSFKIVTFIISFLILIFTFLLLFILNLEVSMIFIVTKIISFIITISIIIVLSYFLFIFCLLCTHFEKKRNEWKFRD